MTSPAVPSVAWVDPRPQYPRTNCWVLVKCEDGSIYRCTLENTWEGPRWKPGGTGFWSMAHPEIIGWKYEHEATPEERSAAK